MLKSTISKSTGSPMPASPDFEKAVWTSGPLKEQAIEDFKTCCLSRECSILARKEALMGKANFGIIGDGKEVAQVALARAMKKGDFRTGYYRDQTLMFALGLLTVEQFFAQLYGDPQQDPNSKARQMNCHFMTPMCAEDGSWLKHKDNFNVPSDTSPTAGQMARALGLALASKKFREHPEISGDFSNNGNEVVFCTIGDASTSEGPFWETVNAAAVQQVPLAICVWDDGYGISVPKKYQTAKESISDVLSGFKPDDRPGMDIITARGWNYTELRKAYHHQVDLIREHHRPTLFHIYELTQQLGHSTSGDHRRYKSAERLQYEIDFDCNARMAEWLIKNKILSKNEIDEIITEAKKRVQQIAKTVYDTYTKAVQAEKTRLLELLDEATLNNTQAAIQHLKTELFENKKLLRSDLSKVARQALLLHKGEEKVTNALEDFVSTEKKQGHIWYSQFLHAENNKSALAVKEIPALFEGEATFKDGFEVLNAFFDLKFKEIPELFAFGEDAGKIGDVNQGLRGMQDKYGETRVFDTGIREWTIMGQAIGMAMRGLRPIAEIQYLDYLLYGLSPLSDDLATLRWRTANQQQAPAIIRTRGHRLVGVWHSGSPMSMMLGSLRGMYICVPRNMTQAAGMYNTLLKSNDPAIVVECLNGYRLKEKLPSNLNDFTVPLGKAEVLIEGSDVTIITYGSSLRIAEKAIELVATKGISVELIDIQTLIPFDLGQVCVASLEKTNRVLFLDEDVPGGASAYMMQEVLENQGGYQFLDAAPRTLAAKPHRPAYGEDGDYFSKPQPEDVAETILRMIVE